MKLHELCTRTGLAKRTVHYYVKEGLIAPSTDPANGYYDFSEEDAARLILIRELRKADVPLQEIRSLIHMPAAAAYYLSRHAGRLRKEIRYLEQTVTSLRYLLDTLPLTPEFSDLVNCSLSAGFPIPPEKEAEWNSDENDFRLVNHFLWRAFLEHAPLTEYREFLWNKLERIAAADVTGDYRLLARYLGGLGTGEIERMYSIRIRQAKQLSQMSPAEAAEYSAEQIAKLTQLVGDRRQLAYWHEHSASFHLPYLRIGTSPEVQRILMELSPFFPAYLKNLRIANDLTFRHLLSKEGEPLLQALRKGLGEELDLELGQHAMIEYLCNLTY